MYSQYSEDDLIVSAFAKRPSETKLFLDIGAWHPTIFSNTRALVELGWGGVMVEPSPGPFINLLRACVQCGDVPREGIAEDESGKTPVPTMACSKCGSTDRYGTSSRFTLILAGVGLNSCLVSFYGTNDALSTSSEVEMRKWVAVGGFYARYLCQVITLEQISNQFGGFDMVNIDAEGVSCDLFLRALAIGWRPRVWCVELDRGREHEVGLAATNAGYQLHMTTGNVLAVQK